MNSIAPYAKAIIGAAVAFLGAIAVGLEDQAVSPYEWVVAAIAGLTALGSVFRFPNRDT